MKQKLALLGGEPAINSEPESLFGWPIITSEDEAAVLDVLRSGAMSQMNITKQLEIEYAEWQGSEYALGFNNGTAALEAAMFGCGIGMGDEIICPSCTYWASALPVYNLRGTVVFADIDPKTLCIDPKDIERHISDRTKAIVVVHLIGHPADMDAILTITARHKLKVIEDVSHSQGGMCKGKKIGTFGDVAAASMMSGKSLVAGEAGMLTTDDRGIYERSLAWAHYARYQPDAVTDPELQRAAGLPWGGHKYRMHQLSAAVARVQLKHYDQRSAEIRKAINYFWDCLEGTPGIVPHRVDEATGSNMAGWYNPRGFFRSEELHGLSVSRFVSAVNAEGVGDCSAGANRPLHLHPLLNDLDVYAEGGPTRIVHSDRDLRQPAGSLPVSESIGHRLFRIPYFKKYHPDQIDRYVDVFRKVVENAESLVAGDAGDPENIGNWNLSGI
jgi:perosamine synthetase